MENFETQITEKIKKLQKVVLKNTASLYEDVRSIVYSRFQDIKYKILKPDEFAQSTAGKKGAAAFYSPTDNTIYFLDYGQKEIQDVLLLHEMLHALSNRNFIYSTDPVDNVSGFRYTKKFNRINSMVIAARNRSINEGATQFFAEKFLDIKFTNAYPFEVHIFSILCDECGIEKMKNAYFDNQIEGVKKIIRDTFHLKNDYLINSLFTYLDVFGVIFNKNEKYYKNLPLVKNCYINLLQMKLNKMIVENDSKISKQDLIDQFDIKAYLMKNPNLLMARFLDSFFDDLSLRKQKFLTNEKEHRFGLDFASQISLLFASAVINQDIDFLEDHLNDFRENALEILKQMCSENLYVRRDELTGQYVKLLNSKAINLFLGYLHNQNDKIDLSNLDDYEKYQFISLALFNNYPDEEAKRYSHFNPKDLVDYINNGLYDCDTFYDEQAMEYIWPEIKNINPSLLEDIKFQNTYINVSQKEKQRENEAKTNTKEFK